MKAFIVSLLVLLFVVGAVDVAQARGRRHHSAFGGVKLATNVYGLSGEIRQRMDMAKKQRDFQGKLTRSLNSLRSSTGHRSRVAR